MSGVLVVLLCSLLGALLPLILSSLGSIFRREILLLLLLNFPGCRSLIVILPPFQLSESVTFLDLSRLLATALTMSLRRSRAQVSPPRPETPQALASLVSAVSSHSAAQLASAELLAVSAMQTSTPTSENASVPSLEAGRSSNFYLTPSRLVLFALACVLLVTSLGGFAIAIVSAVPSRNNTL